MTGDSATGVRRWAVVYYPSRLASWLVARLWLRFKVKGREHVPASGPFLLVANHQSFLDPFLLGIGGGPAVAFLARASLARFPPIRWWLAGVGVILIDREAPARADLRKILASLDDGTPAQGVPDDSVQRNGSDRDGARSRRQGERPRSEPLLATRAAYGCGAWEALARRTRA